MRHSTSFLIAFALVLSACASSGHPTGSPHPIYVSAEGEILLFHDGMAAFVSTTNPAEAIRQARRTGDLYSAVRCDAAGFRCLRFDGALEMIVPDNPAKDWSLGGTHCSTPDEGPRVRVRCESASGIVASFTYEYGRGLEAFSRASRFNPGGRATMVHHNGRRLMN